MNFNKILIGIDESKYADHAAKYGFELAAKFGAAVGLVNIIEPVPTAVSPMTDTTFGMPFEGVADVNTPDLINVQNKAADSLLGRIVAKYGNNDLQITQFTDYGASADGIINCAAQFGADVIVIGTHHRSGLDRFLMGSVAEGVVRHSPIPVLVVPLNEEEEKG
jgi:nucleotide-binding universal stress UspA family protein